VTGSADPAADARDLSHGLIGAGIAVCAWSTGTVLAKGIDMGGLAIGAYRFAFFAMAIVVWMRLRGAPFRLRVMRDSMWGGLALGADIALFFSAVKLTSIVNATIIGSLQPIVVGVIAARFFGERIRLRDAAWSLVALGGVVAVVSASAGDDVHDIRGDLLALAAMLSWSAYFVASKKSKQRMTSTEFTAGTALWTAMICAPLGVAFGQDMSWPSWEARAMAYETVTGYCWPQSIGQGGTVALHLSSAGGRTVSVRSPGSGQPARSSGPTPSPPATTQRPGARTPKAATGRLPPR
jgi:drug/metabolite transporter (DMT)-like permease